MKWEEEAMKALLALLVDVTVELQYKLRCMFLETSQRCHYVFTMNDLGVIFRLNALIHPLLLIEKF